MKFKDIEKNKCICIICGDKTLDNRIEKEFIICHNCHEEISIIKNNEEIYDKYIKRIKNVLLKKYNF